jgi:phage gp29-like protein
MLGGVGFLPQHLYNLMDCVGKGFSVSEIIWEVNDNGIGVKEILNRPQRRFQFDAEDRTLRLRSILAPYFGEPLPDKKFIVHRVSSTWENPFGDPLDQNIYWIWLFKRTVLKFWMQHLEVGAASVPIVKHPASANAEMKSEALAIAKQIRSGAYGRIPENFEILWAEAKNAITNAQTYEMFVKMCDEQVSKAIQGQTLTTDTGKSGTRAQGQVHQVTQDARDLFRAHGLESTLNTTLVKWAVDFNFANVDGYPRFRFDLEESEDLVNEAGIVKTISDAGYNFDEEELSEKFNYSLTKKEPLMSILPSGSGSQSPTAEFSQNKLLDAVIAVAVGGEKGKKEFVGLIEQKEDSFFEKFSGVFSKAIESLKPPIVNVEAPVVNVQSPAINVAPPIVHVPAPVVNVQPASVNVIMPEPKQKKMKIVAPDGKVYSIESNG